MYLSVKTPLLLLRFVIGKLLALVLILRGAELLQLFVGPDPGAALDVGPECVPTVPAAETGAGAVAGGAAEVRVFLALPGAGIDLPLPFGVLRACGSESRISNLKSRISEPAGN